MKLDLAGTYAGVDRFGRTKSQVWGQVGLFGVTLYDQTDYTYDYAGNRLTRDVRVDLINGSYPDTRDQKYASDGLHRLLNYDQGTLASGSISGSNRQRSWQLDPLGNWAETFSDLSQTTSEQERDHNAVNEITEIDSSTTHVAHDDAGNMTKLPKPDNWSAHFDLKYDAWNRLVEVKDGSNVVQQNEYDGLGQRIVRVDAAASLDVTYDYYYNDQWQLLTEVHDGNVEALYFWHPYYIDALALRMRAGDTHWFTHDANFNVTAAVDDSTGAVVERYSYTPYGEVTFLEPDFDVASSQVSVIDNTHLYTGRERDPETGLQLNRHRYYASWLGRWLRRDRLSLISQIVPSDLIVIRMLGAPSQSLQYRQMQELLTRLREDPAKNSPQPVVEQLAPPNPYLYGSRAPITTLDPSGELFCYCDAVPPTPAYLCRWWEWGWLTAVTASSGNCAPRHKSCSWFCQSRNGFPISCKTDGLWMCNPRGWGLVLKVYNNCL